MKYLVCFFTIVSWCFFTSTAFDWPQQTNDKSPLFASFGQQIGNTINTALIFSEPAEINAIGDGQVLAVVNETSRGSNWFPSALGNMVLVIHPDKMLSVYGNLDTISINNSISVSTNTQLGNSGTSGWQSGKNSLILQVIDLEQNRIINPAILLSRIEQQQKRIVPGPIYLINKEGQEYELGTVKTIAADTYKVYRQIENDTMPYSTTLTVNGAIAESITYDSASADRGSITISGKDFYTAHKLYPLIDRQFIGEIALTRGRNVLSATTSNIAGIEATITYTLQVW